MKKSYVSPRMDIVYMVIENRMLAGSNGTGGLPGGPGSAKAYGFDQNDFSDEFLCNDEIDGNNE
ncbi:hypothetical protein [Hallella bergensis]|uniref:hypothetical protein n=1 Tax=Hallella bergensis TaxID=242750 RepID=UPI003990941E